MFMVLRKAVSLLQLGIPLFSREASLLGGYFVRLQGLLLLQKIFLVMTRCSFVDFHRLFALSWSLS